jgi:hypothetical protein
MSSGYSKTLSQNKTKYIEVKPLRVIYYPVDALGHQLCVAKRGQGLYGIYRTQAVTGLNVTKMFSPRELTHFYTTFILYLCFDMEIMEPCETNSRAKEEDLGLVGGRALG